MRAVLLAILFLVLAPWFMGLARAHDWYSDTRDPEFSANSCCGGDDCAVLVVEPGVLSAEADGYRIKLTLEQSRKINAWSNAPLDALVPWHRVQDSPDGNYHLCIMSNDRSAPRWGVYCFFVPPNT